MSVVQSILFNRLILVGNTTWNLNSAKRWLKEHGFIYSKVDRTDHYYRFRQQSPDKFSRFRTKDIHQKGDLGGSGITFILGFP